MSRRSKKLNDPYQDVTGRWKKRVDAMADRLGWIRRDLWGQWAEIALMIEFEHRKMLSRPLSEGAAFRMLEALVDKAGSVAN